VATVTKVSRMGLTVRVSNTEIEGSLVFEIPELADVSLRYIYVRRYCEEHEYSDGSNGFFASSGKG
jgi:hypothetical protein